MREEYDFSKAKRNTYVKKIQKQIIINMDSNAIACFENQVENCDILYQRLRKKKNLK